MKQFVLFSLTLLTAMGVKAQGDIKFGFQLSPTFTWLTTDDNKINSNGTNLSMKLGMIGEYFFRENYSISTGLGFHFNAGGQLFYDETLDSLSIWSEAGIPGSNVYPGGTNFKYSLQYVEIPIGLKLRTREFGYLRYYVEPQLAIAFRSQAKGNVTNATGIDAEEDYEIKSAVNVLNLSWGIGGGLEYSLSSNTALVGGLALQTSFTDITKDKNTSVTRTGNTTEEDSKAKLWGIVLRLGVMF